MSVVPAVIILCVLSLSPSVYTDTLIEFTDTVFGSAPPNGVLAAFGDFNADRFTDLFFIADRGLTLSVYLANELEPLLRPSRIGCQFTNGIITSVVPGDYDGDSQMDILITIMHHNQNPGDRVRHWKILWGSQSELECGQSNNEDAIYSFYGQPLVFDYDGNRIPDLFGEFPNRTRVIWQMKNYRNGTFPGADVIVPSTRHNRKLRDPNSHAFVDVSSNHIADWVITTEEGIEIWWNDNGRFNREEYFEWPQAAHLGQLLTVDIDLDQRIDLLLPVCYDLSCNNSSILLLDRNNRKWLPMFSGFHYDTHHVGFVPPMEPSSLSFASDAITLHHGDYNLDGYPDVIAVLQDSQTANRVRKAYVLQNVPSPSSSTNRTFEIQWDTNGLRDLTNVTLATFYDIGNDGILDVLAVEEDNSKKAWKIHAYQNAYASDAFFIKVIVLSGLCYRTCPNNRVPFGTNQPGPTVCYTIVTPDSATQASCAGQLTQSAYFALQLPYVSFGLGRIPNFVDSLKVAIPNSHQPYAALLEHEWRGIIPNSQMFVIPYLETEGYKWFNKLYVTPSHLVIITFAALMGTMGVIAILIFGLHWKERREDKKEKLQEAHRFHFDAM